MLHRTKTARRGSLLAVAILVTSVLVLLAAIVGSSTMLHMQTTTQVGGKKEARYIAYSGLQEAMARLLEDEAACDQWPYSIEGLMPNDSSLRYEVKIWANISGSRGEPVVPGTSITVPSGAAYIDSMGYRIGASGPRTKLVGGMAGLAYKNKPVFDQAAFGDLFIGLTNRSWTDSYDSFGVYGGPPSNAPGGLAGAGNYGGGNNGGNNNGGNNNGGNNNGGNNSGGSTPPVGQGTIAGSGYMAIDGGSWVDGNAELSPIAKLNPLFAGESPFGGSTGDSSTTGGPTGGMDSGGGTVGGAVGGAGPGGPMGSGGGGDSDERVRITPGSLLTGKVQTAAEPTVVPGFRAPYQKTLLDPVVDTSTLPHTSSGGGNNNQGDDDDDDDNSPPPPPPPPPQAELPPNTTYKSVTVPPGDHVKLKSGTYYISDSFTADGAEIEIDSSGGPVILYVGAAMNLTNTRILATKPRDLQIYFTDEVPEEEAPPIEPESTDGPTMPTRGSSEAAAIRSGSVFKMKGGSGTFVAAGRNTLIDLESTEVFGSVVGQVITASGTALHYDKTLKGMPLAGVSNWVLEGVHETTR